MDTLSDLPARVIGAVRWRTKHAWRRSLGKRAYESKLTKNPSLARIQATLESGKDGYLDLADQMLDSRLSADTPPRDAFALLLDAVLIREQLNGALPSYSDRVFGVAEKHRERAVSTALRYVTYLCDTGRFEAATQFTDLLFQRTGLVDYARRSHALAIDDGNIDKAKAVRHEIETQPVSSQDIALLRAAEARAVNNHEQVMAELAGALPSYTRQFSQRLLDELAKSGQQNEILDYIASTESGLTRSETITRIFDAKYALGDEEDAIDSLRSIPTNEADERVIERLQRALGPDAVSDIMSELLDASEQSAERSALEDRGIILFRSNRPGEAVETLRRAEKVAPLAPPARQALAQSLYSLRRFEEAALEAKPLRTTRRAWAGRKLEGRILIQLDRPAEALENRLQFGRPGDDTDQVKYHALLNLGRFDEAFQLHPFVEDLADLRSDFLTSAEHFPVDRVHQRFIISDAGPGDEIQDASTYNELAPLSDELIATCDPRLHTLLERSFPSIRFLPVERLRNPPHLGSHGPGAPQRSGRALDRLLTAEADAVARGSDRVVLGRAVKNVRDFSRGPKPQPAFLSPDKARVDAIKTSRGSQPTVGVVWRSELQTSWRAINYLAASDLAPLATLDTGFVCLQHDATSSERTTLKRIFGDRVRFYDEIDLRDDFEETAALVAGLDVVLGVGTTMTNLAASVGTRTLMLQPSSFGRWLDIGEGRDFWFEACRSVQMEANDAPEVLVQKATKLTAQILEQA